MLIAICALTGVISFSLYALIFASRMAERYLHRAQRGFHLICGDFTRWWRSVFCYLWVSMLIAQLHPVTG